MDNILQYLQEDFLKYEKKYNKKNMILLFLRNRAYRYSTLLRIGYFNKNSKLITLGIRILLKPQSTIRHIEISHNTQIGYGIYFGHFHGVTINSGAQLGNNINIHKGVTIGQESRGKRKGTPILGNKVWIGVNSTIVGNITIGNNVLIAPNSFVNFDIPSDSIVVGNKIIHCKTATDGYIL